MFKAFGFGRFVADPELTELPDMNTCVCNLRLAINERRRSQGETINETHFFNFEIWDSAARTVVEQARKGDSIYFESVPRQQKWKDSVTGEERSKNVFRITEFRVSPKVNREE